jgi:hypothetical protein
MTDAQQEPAKRIRDIQPFQPHICRAALLALFILTSCTTVRESFKSSPTERAAEKRTDQFERSKALVAEGNYDEAYNENQKILFEGKGAPDVALFNMGMVSASPLNPRKNYPRALVSFKTLVKNHPQSPLTEQAKIWIQVLEEHQKIAEERQKVLEDKQKLLEERRGLIREREMLSHEKEKLAQEREKFKYTVEKSRQVDIDIEKRRRQALTK